MLPITSLFSRVSCPVLRLMTCFALMTLCAEDLYSQDNQAQLVAVIAQDSFRVAGNEVFRKNDNHWKTVATFPLPSIPMLIRYRPEVRGDFGFNKRKTNFFDVVEDVSSDPQTMYVSGTRIWVGFAFYEGEGFEGYGGIGFYDSKTNQIGVLRHPALVDYSVKSLLVTDTVIYVQTVGNYELSSSVGYGLVMLDTKTLLTKAIVPPGTSTLWDKDDTVSASAFYNRPIAVVLSDHRFVANAIPQFDPVVIAHGRSIGLDSLMFETAQCERAFRDSLKRRAGIVIDTVLTVTQQRSDVYLRIRQRIVLEFVLLTKYGMEIHLGSSVHRLKGEDAKRDIIISHEDAKYLFFARLKDFIPQRSTSGFESITIHATVKQLK